MTTPTWSNCGATRMCWRRGTTTSAGMTTSAWPRRCAGKVSQCGWMCGATTPGMTGRGGKGWRRCIYEAEARTVGHGFSRDNQMRQKKAALAAEDRRTKMKKIGVLFGQENTFPGALVERINAMDVDGVRAEFVQVGGVEMAKPCPYAVIVDRISHDVPFYRSYLKNAAMTGTVVINNPFWWSADDKFFNYALAEKLGVAVPKTVLLPSKFYTPMTDAKSFRNLEFPLRWDEI